MRGGLAAFPRWSGGYLQMMLDPMMQRINDEGPLPVFAKEIRANGAASFERALGTLQYTRDAAGHHL
jgi:hypothetical protein